MKTLAADTLRYFALNPTAFCKHILHMELDEKQADIMQGLATRQMTSVRSGHGVGKSAVEAAAILWYLCTRPFPKIPCTAPTMHQLIDILWAEIRKWMRQSPVIENTFAWTQQRIYHKQYPEEWFAVARTATTPDALQGFHANHVLYIIDEASGVDDRIFEPVLGALSTEGAKLLMCGNPTQLSGIFYDSHHKNREHFCTLHIDGRTSQRVSAEYVQSIIDMYGEDSDVFRVRVAGEFPKATSDAFIAMEWCEKASKLTPNIEKVTRIDIGVDVARFGDDSSVLCAVLDKSLQLEPLIYHHNETMELTGKLIQFLRRLSADYPGATMVIKIDCDGLGVGVYDRLKEQLDTLRAELNRDYKTLDAIECHFGGAGGSLKEGDPIEYANSTGLMWGTVREALRTGTLALHESAQQISQLSNRRYAINSAGRIELERKESMKRRGLPSPDIGDALALAMWEPYKPSYDTLFI
ncbi:hypothetical protein AGMMS49992_20240 [Clostridia bacterium]|nr:hypothetical protein AGMMS49992_20240 [Clostridia bacterium]